MDISGVPSPPYSQAPNPPSNHPPPPYPGIRANGMLNGQPDKSFLKAQVEVDLLNHCFDDMEVFMGKLQQSAEAQMVLNQRSKKNKRSQKKSADEDLLTAKAKPPFEKEFIDTFQKFKYSFSLLARLKSSISNPTSDELLHHVFKPLDMIVKASGGPGLAASVSSPAMTQAAISLMKNNLTTQEQELWTLLGPNWTQNRSALRSPVDPYTPTFLDGWRPPGSDVPGWVDPVEIQHKQDAELSKVEFTSHPSYRQTPLHASDQTDSMVKERSYRCSYDFVARNSTELSVLQGETLEVIESSKRWWKCRNKFNEVGFVPFNLLEPITHIDNPVMRRTPKPPAAPPISNNLPMLSAVTSDPSSPRPRSMVLGSQHLPEDTEKVMQVNDELLQRLTSGKNLPPRLTITRSMETTAQLDYSSSPDEVENWLRKKGFSQPTVQCLGVLNGAQLFSLNKEELRAVIPEEGARVYSQLTVQRALLEDARRSTELETVMERQKMKVDLKLESGTL